MQSVGFFVVRSLRGDGAWLLPPGCGHDNYHEGLFLSRPEDGILDNAAQISYAYVKPSCVCKS